MIKEKWNGSGPSEKTVARRSQLILGANGSWQRVLLAGWAWIVGITVVVTGAAAVVAEMQPHVYKAQAQVAVYPANATGTALQPFVMGTEKGIASSDAVLSIASKALFVPITTLRNGVAVTVPVDADLLVISFSDRSPQLAQSAAESIAQAYIAYRTWKTSPGAATPGTAPATTQGIQAAIVSDAVLPVDPSSPNRKLIVGVALLLGFVLGIGVALLRDMLNDGLRGALDLQSQADAPVLGQIPAFNRKRRSPTDGLVVLRNPSSSVAEAYRNLRTRVLQVAAWRRATMVLVTSPGGEDRATIAANLAAAMALSGRDVILASADLRWGGAHAVFGLENRVGLTNVISGDVELGHALLWTEVPRLRVLAGGQAYFDPSSVLQSAAFAQLFAELRRQAEFVVIEAPPVLTGAETAAIAELGAMILLVADAKGSTRADVRAAVQELAHVREDLIGCVLDNLGRARRLPQGSIPAAMRTMNLRAKPETETIADGSPNGHAEPHKEPLPTSIHGEV